MNQPLKPSDVKKLFFAAAWVLLLLGSCRREEEGLTSRTGNLEITFRAVNSTVRFRGYFLYSEAVYFSATPDRENLWLRRGGSGVNRIDIKGLNPGNYVIVVELEGGGTTVGSVQVTASQTNRFAL